MSRTARTSACAERRDSAIPPLQAWRSICPHRHPELLAPSTPRVRSTRPRPLPIAGGSFLREAPCSTPLLPALNVLLPRGGAVANEVTEVGRGRKRRHGCILRVIALLIAQGQRSHQRGMDAVQLR